MKSTLKNNRVLPLFLAWLALSCLLCISVNTQAKPKNVFANQPLKPWKSQVPSGLLPLQNDIVGLAALTKDSVLVYPHAKRNIVLDTKKNGKITHTSKKVDFISSAVILNAKPSQVKALLSNYQNYPKLFPKLVSAKLLNKKANLARVKYRVVIDIPIPILKFDKNFILRHQIQGNTLNTWIEFSPVRYGMGQFQWHHITKGKHQGKTLLTLTQWGDLNNMRGLVLPQIIKAMPTLKMGIPNGVNAYVMEALRLHINGADNPKTYEKQHIIPKWTIAEEAKPTLNKLMKNTQTFPILFAHPPRKLNNETTLRFVSSLQKMPAPAHKVNQWLMQPKKHPKLFKQIKKVTTTPYKNGSLVTSEIRVGLGVISIPFQTKLYFEKPSPNQAKFYAQGGDVKWIAGNFKTFDSKQGNSFLMTTFTSKTDKTAPFLLRMAHSLPYHDYLSSIGVAPIVSYKVKQKL